MKRLFTAGLTVAVLYAWMITAPSNRVAAFLPTLQQQLAQHKSPAE